VLMKKRLNLPKKRTCLIIGEGKKKKKRAKSLRKSRRNPVCREKIEAAQKEKKGRAAHSLKQKKKKEKKKKKKNSPFRYSVSKGKGKRSRSPRKGEGRETA